MKITITSWSHPFFVLLGILLLYGGLILLLLFVAAPIGYAVESWWSYWGMG